VKSLTLPQIAAIGFVVGVVFHLAVFSAVLSDDGPKSDGDSSSGGGQTITIATAVPTATRLADRTSCDEIRGSDYRSAAERQWFLANC
jgi:hypothetical protein